MNAVLKRKVLYVQAQFESPVNVSSGENEELDSCGGIVECVITGMPSVLVSRYLIN